MGDDLVQAIAESNRPQCDHLVSENDRWTDGQVRQVIELEKLLCAALNRQWMPSGMSLVSLIEDVTQEIKHLRAAETELLDLKEGRTLLLPINQDHADKMVLIGTSRTSLTQGSEDGR